MVALGSCVDRDVRFAAFKRIVAQLIHTGAHGETRIHARNSEREKELIAMARGARKHYLGCFPMYKGAEGFGRADDPRVPVPLTRLQKELLGLDTTMLPQWSPVFSNSENFWDNVNRQVYMKKRKSSGSRKTRGRNSSAGCRSTRRAKSR